MTTEDVWGVLYKMDQNLSKQIELKLTDVNKLPLSIHAACSVKCILIFPFSHHLQNCKKLLKEVFWNSEEFFFFFCDTVHWIFMVRFLLGIC